MAMNKIPTLILGIGGIGCRIAANINELLRPEDRDHIGIVGMDTNVNDLKKLANSGIRTIQTSDERTVGDYLRMHPEYMSWFPVHQFTVSRGMLNGAGQIRAISRLAALASEENGRFIPIKEEIQRIRENRGEGGNGNLTVMVVGSTTGGTGAGLFLQMPYYIRKVMQGETGLNVIIRGMFIGPDLTADVQPSKINRSAVRVNGYTCLKELNALYMRQTQPDTPGKLKIDFYTPTQVEDIVVDDIRRALEDSEYLEEVLDGEAITLDATVIAKGNPEIPYDYLYLIEGDGSESSGGIGNAPLDSVESLAARMVHTLMFTPVSDNALSVEDNMVLQDMEKGGMNRYSSAGLSRLIYPRDLAREYVTLCAVRDLVKEEWMLLDDGYANEVNDAVSRQQTDGRVKIPLMKNSYVDLFRGQTKPGKPLSRLYSEAFVQDDKRNETVRTAVFFKGLKDLISQVSESDEVKKAVADCSMSTNKMKTFKSAKGESSRVYLALEDYAKLAKQLAEEKAAGIANELIPPSVQSMRQRKDSKQNIYGLLHNVHPLTARFLCYDIILQIEKDIAKLEKSIAGIDLEDYLQDDFDSKEKDVQDAVVAIGNKQKKLNPVAKAVVEAVGMEETMIRKITTKLSAQSTRQRDLITKYWTESLRLNVLQILLKRMEILAENYRVFFQSIGTMIKENAVRIEELENLKMPLNQIGIYCSKEAFQIMTADYRNHSSFELPAETKTAIFDKLFELLATELEQEGKARTERQKVNQAAKKVTALGKIFRTAVVDTIRTDVVKKGSDILDMSIIQAMEKQYELEMPDMSLDEYLRSLIEKGMRQANPMLATSSNAAAERTETVYMAVHPDCAATEMGEPNAGATQKKYIPQACEATDGMRATVLIDEAFSPYEITCFKARYKFSIEDLVKYAPDSENARAYNIRIGNLGKRPPNIGDPDAFKTVVNPHLDRYWHEEAYLPSIYNNERRRSRVNLYKAFIYALGMDLVSCMMDESVLDDRGNPRKSWYPEGSSIPLKIRGGRIGGTYVDLYQSLPFNGRVKKAILETAKGIMKTEKSNRSAQELMEQILDMDFINDLIHPVSRDGEGDKNILDILLEMRDSMKNDEWKNLFTGLKEALWEYCAYLLDKNERMVNDAVKLILDKMYASCAVAGKEESAMTYGERDLKNQLAAIRSQVYRSN